MRPIYPLRLARAVIWLVLAASVVTLLRAARADSFAETFPTLPEADWAGMRLMILPQSKSLQHYGYQELYKDSDKEYAPLRYPDYAGRIARVVGIGHGRAEDGEIFDEADLQFEDTKETIHGDIDQGCMNDVAPVSDLENARTLYLGKTLWFSGDHLTTYDSDKDVSDAPTPSAWQAAFGKVKVKQFSAVKVMDIVPGWYASAPIRFLVREETGEPGTKKIGYVDVHMSDTNVPASLQKRGRFEDTFLEIDPRITYAWPPKIWAAIENKEVFVGMTAPQVRMSWGEPKEISRDAAAGSLERWVYEGHHVLTMEDGRLRTLPK